jgi:hypothetical protein
MFDVLCCSLNSFNSLIKELLPFAIFAPSRETPHQTKSGVARNTACHRTPKKNSSAAHRDGSPYPIRTGHIPDPKAVGRTVPVSRSVFRVFRMLKCVQFFN